MDINEVSLLGTIKTLSDIQTLKNGQQCCWFTVSTDVAYFKGNETIGSNTVLHHVVAYGNYARIIKRESSKSQRIFIHGRLKTVKWTRHGQHGVEFSKTFIVLERFKLHLPKQARREESSENETEYHQEYPEESFDDEEEFVPKPYLYPEYDLEWAQELRDLHSDDEATGWAYPD